MPYDDVTDRSNPGGGALVPTEESRTIIQMATQQSAALRMFKKVPILTNQKSFPVLSSLPLAYFLDTANVPTSDTSLIQTTEMAWKNIYMNVAEIAVIAPFPRRVMEDIKAGGINLTEEMKPALAQAAALTIDRAAFFGTNRPAAWPVGVAPAALAAGNQHEATTTAANGGLHSDIIKTMKLMRADGFRPNAGIGRGLWEYDLLDARDTTGQPLYRPANGVLGSNTGSILGTQIQWETDGVFPTEAAGAAQLVLFDSTKHMVGIREDINISVHKEGVITDGAGAVVWNLLQQDMIAIRMMIRVGMAVANPLTLAQPTEASRYPGAVLISNDGV